jgi:thioesterase domain-containing protein
VLGLPLPEAAAPCDLSELARPLVRAVRERQPQGPYFLAGWCAYGRIAYEVAQQLQDQGQEVAMVVLINSPAPGQRRRATSISGRWRHIRFETRYHLASLSELRPREVLAYILERLLRIIRLGFTGAGGVEALTGNKRLLRQIVATPHGPVPYAGRVIVFRSRLFSQRGNRASTGWGAVAANNLELVDVPGDHVTMFLEPNVDVLARELNQRLRQCHRHDPQQ